MQPTRTVQWKQPFDNKRFRILFVDDEPFAVSSVRKVLEAAAYTVYTAETYDEAIDILASTHIHLGIFDLNLSRKDETGDDGTASEYTGLDLASNPNFPHLRMVYTGQKEYEFVLESLKHPQAVDYIVKGDGSKKELLHKVQLAITGNLTLNQDLVLHWQNISLQQIVQTIYPDLSLAEQLEHIIELEDLFRMQFFSVGQEICQQITVQGLSVDKPGRVWLRVSAYTRHGRPYESLVLCGEQSIVLQEDKQFDRVSPRITQMRTPPRQTVHYATHKYDVYDNQLFETDTLSTYLKAGHYDLVAHSLDTIHDVRFQGHYQQNISLEKGTLYQLAKGEEEALQWEITEKLFNIVGRLNRAWQQTIKSQLHVNQSNILYRSSKSKQQRYPNPIFYLEMLGNYETKRPVGTVHGDLRLASIFVQGSDREIYLLDYADVREASVLRDYVTLERSIHIELLSQEDIENYQELAQYLNNNEAVSSLTPKIQLAVRYIRQIRQLALQDTGCITAAYLQDLYIDFVTYLLSYPERKFVSYETIRRYAHCLLFAGQICAELEQPGVIALNAQDNQDGIWLDATGNRLRVLGKSVSLTDKQFGIFEYLYQNLNQPCTYADIIKNGLREDLLHNDVTLEKPRIQTAVSRLRKEVQDFGFEIESWREGYSLRRTNGE